MNDYQIQVPSDHYYKNYDDLLRFISYYYQIDIVKSLNPSRILEIGIGNKTVSNYLRQNGFNIDTCDFDKNLLPDYLADIRKLPFDDNSYDLILVSEVLEHIPWEDLEKALQELHRISKKNLVISIPYSSAAFEIIIKVPLFDILLRKLYFSFLIRIPYFFKKIEFKGEHYWEMGRKNYSKRKLQIHLLKYFQIIKEISPILNHYHYFYIMEKLNKIDNNI